MVLVTPPGAACYSIPIGSLPEKGVMGQYELTHPSNRFRSVIVQGRNGARRLSADGRYLAGPRDHPRAALAARQPGRAGPVHVPRPPAHTAAQAGKAAQGRAKGGNIP